MCVWCVFDVCLCGGMVWMMCVRCCVMCVCECVIVCGDCGVGGC